MVKIKLLSFEKEIAVISCSPEGKDENAFILKLDLNKKKILENSLNEKGNPYAIHAAWKIYDLYEENGAIPQTAIAAWC